MKIPKDVIFVGIAVGVLTLMVMKSTVAESTRQMAAAINLGHKQRKAMIARAVRLFVCALVLAAALVTIIEIYFL